MPPTNSEHILPTVEKNLLIRRIRAASAFLAIAVMLIGGGHLVAWLTGHIASLGAATITMKTNTAVGLLFAGVSLLLVRDPQPGQGSRVLAGGFAIFSGLIGLLTLAEHLIGLDLRVDEFLASEPAGAIGAFMPNRMGPPASLGLLLSSIGLLLLNSRRSPGIRLAQSLGVAVCLIGMLGAIGYLYSVEVLYGLTRLTATAWPTALGFVCLGLGLLCARPAQGLVKAATAADAGGAVIRRLLLPSILLPVLLGWLRLAGEWLGFYPTAAGTALLVVSFVVVFSLLVYHSGRRLSESVAAETRARDLAHEQAAKFRDTLENMAEGYLALDRNGVVADLNRHAEAMLGRDRRGILGHNLWEELPMAGDSLLRQEAERAFREQARVSFEEYHPPLDLWLEVHACPAADRLSVFLRDISQRKRSEAALRESEERYRAAAERMRAIMEAAPGGILVAHDPQCHLVTGNGPAHEVLGVPCGQSLSLTRLDAGPPPYRMYRNGQEVPGPELPMQTAGASGCMVREEEYDVVRCDGSRRTILITAAPLRAEDGTLTGAVGAIVDITVRKQAEEALRRSEEKFRAVFEQAAIGMGRVRFDDARWIDVNEAFCRMLGYSAEEMRATPWPQMTHSADVDLDLVPFRRMGTGELDSYTVEKRFIHRQGHPVWARLTLSLVRDALGRPDYEVAIVEDIRARKQAETELADARQSAERARNVAEEASAAKDRFLAVLSHELRTPLTPVLAAVSMLQRRGSASAPADGELEIIRRNIELEARLIDDLLDLTRIARGKIELDRRPVLLGTIIDRAVGVCRPDLEARGMHFAGPLGEDACGLVEADTARLQQVFWNLLRNSIKFTPHGGCIGIRCRLEHGRAVVQVSDSGVGIEAEALPRIFDAFAQASRGITRQFGGLGLGLAICKSLVEMHGGTIEAHSEGRDRGATFTVRLPLISPAPDSPALAGPFPAASAPATTAGPLRMLVVEDHGDTAEMLRLMLEAEGHSVETAGDVGTALESAGRTAFDLVISDLGLPDGSGLDLMRELRARGLDLPGIALSGYGQEQDVRQSEEAGFSTHITKPVDLDRLVEAVCRVTAA
jgi:PAS domain S-box-containing protein